MDRKMNAFLNEVTLSAFLFAFIRRNIYYDFTKYYCLV